MRSSVTGKSGYFFLLCSHLNKNQISQHQMDSGLFLTLSDPKIKKNVSELAVFFIVKSVDIV